MPRAGNSHRRNLISLYRTHEILSNGAASGVILVGRGMSLAMPRSGVNRDLPCGDFEKAPVDYHDPVWECARLE